MLIGFLPPEDGTGRGLGYFSYTVMARAGLPTGTQFRNVATGEIKDVSPERGLPAGVTARHTWTLPLVFSKADPHALYFSDQFLFKTTNGGESWTQISPDLTREDPGVPPNLDAATASDAPEGKRRGVIYTIAPSPLRAQTIWVGTDDGLIHRTDDDGKTWAAVTPPELTAWSKVVMLDASHFDVSEAYAAIDRHRLEDYEAHIYRTRDGGKASGFSTTSRRSGS